LISPHVNASALQMQRTFAIGGKSSILIPAGVNALPVNENAMNYRDLIHEHVNVNVKK